MTASRSESRYPAAPQGTPGLKRGHLACDGGRRATLAEMPSRDWALEQRVRGAARVRLEQLSGSWLAILQSAVAAGVAWALAKLVVGQPEPFFAPAAAVISLGLSRGQPRRRAIELSIGVAVGIGIAAAIVYLIGVGPIQVTVLVALVMAASLLLNGSQVLINQAAVSALLIMTLPGQGAEIDRFLDACVGGAVAIAFGFVFSFHEPLAAVEEARRGALADLAAALESIAAALSRSDLAPPKRRWRAPASSTPGSTSSTTRSPKRVRPPPSRPAAAPCSRSSTRRRARRRRSTTRCATPASSPARRRPRSAAARTSTRASPRGSPPWPRRPGRSTRSAAASRAPAPTSANSASQAVELAGSADVRNSLWPTMIFGQTRAIAFDLMQAAGEDADRARALLDAAATTKIAPPPAPPHLAGA